MISNKLVLAYSGGLNASILIPWLIENHDVEVIAMIADVGQAEDLDAIVAKAYDSGAKKAVVRDLRAEFVSEFIFPAVRAGAAYAATCPVGTALARSVIAKAQIEIAREEAAASLAHGCTGSNDELVFERAYEALAPKLKIVAPCGEWSLRSIAERLAYAEAHGVQAATHAKENSADIISRDRNLWGVRQWGAELEDAGEPPYPEIWQLTCATNAAPDRDEFVAIGFESGNAISVDGMRLEPVQLLELLTEIGARNAIGRVDAIENSPNGGNVRTLCESPGGALMVAAHRELETLTLDPQAAQYKQFIALRYAELIMSGHWYGPLREALDAFVTRTQENVTGTVTLSLYKGNIAIARRTSSWGCVTGAESMDQAQSSI